VSHFHPFVLLTKNPVDLSHSFSTNQVDETLLVLVMGEVLVDDTSIKD